MAVVKGRTVVAVALVALVAALAAPAGAQDAESEARTLFERGSAAVRAGRLADARRDLERSLTLMPRASTGFNLVVALRGMGALVAAGDVCARLLGGDLGVIAESQRAQADDICADTRAGIATLYVRAIGAAPFELRLDGLSLGALSPGEDLDQPIDPGAHVVTIVAEGRPPQDRAVDAARGERVELEIEGPRAPDPGPDVGWIVAGTVGGAAIVAAIVVGIAVAATSGPSADYPVVATLRF